MALQFASMCNDPERLRCALFEARTLLVTDDAPQGWGLACYQGGEPLLRRQPKPHQGTLDFYGVLEDLRSDYVIGHVQQGEHSTKVENTQPFRFRSWVFSLAGSMMGPAALDHQGGTLPTSFPEVKDKLLSHMPDFLRRNIGGTTPSEHVFFLFLSFLHDTGNIDDPNVKVECVASALAGTAAYLERDIGVRPTIDVMVTNGRSVCALHTGKEMVCYRLGEVKDCQVCQKTVAAADNQRITHEHLHAVLLVNNPAKAALTGVDAKVETVPQNTVVGVARDLTTTFHPLKPALL